MLKAEKDAESLERVSATAREMVGSAAMTQEYADELTKKSGVRRAAVDTANALLTRARDAAKEKPRQ